MTKTDWSGVLGAVVAIAGCILSNWSVVGGFFVAALGAVLVCRAIALHRLPYVDTSGDLEYDRLVMRSILPKGSNVSIDKVAEALNGENLGSFSLAEHKEGATYAS